MGSRFVQFWVILICFSIVMPILSSKTQPVISPHPRSRILHSQTNLKIGLVQLNFHIRSTGEYRCTFSLEFLGTDQTANGLGGGEFTVPS